MNRRSESAKRVNRHEPDPITNKVMADYCWDGYHANGKQATKCAGWLEFCDDCNKQSQTYGPFANKTAHPDGCNCECHCRCECECHAGYVAAPRVKRDPKATLHMVDDLGCGTIEV